MGGIAALADRKPDLGLGFDYVCNYLCQPHTVTLSTWSGGIFATEPPIKILPGIRGGILVYRNPVLRGMLMIRTPIIGVRIYDQGGSA